MAEALCNLDHSTMLFAAEQPRCESTVFQIVVWLNQRVA
jgi:hypothetical protein